MVATKKAPASKDSSKGQRKIQKVMQEFKEGELEMGRSGKKVTSRKQAVAIALSEAREAGAKIPPPPEKGGKRDEPARSIIRQIGKVFFTEQFPKALQKVKEIAEN